MAVIGYDTGSDGAIWFRPCGGIGILPDTGKRFAFMVL